MRVLFAYLLLQTVSAQIGSDGQLRMDVASSTTEYGDVYNFHLLPDSTTSASTTESSTDADDEDGHRQFQDPLDCCEQTDTFIHPNWRAECDLHLKWVPQQRLININYIDSTTKTNGECEDLTPSESCVLQKMGLLNEFGFIDHFKMKNKIRAYSNGMSSYLYAVFNSAFLNVPYYRDKCNSSRRLFNLIDVMLVVCPTAKRRSTRQCNQVFSEITDSVTDISKESLARIVDYPSQSIEYYAGYLSTPAVLQLQNQVPTTSGFLEPRSDVNEPKSRVQNNLRYDFGVLGMLGKEPEVTTIDVIPKSKTLVLYPVYQRTPKNDPLALSSLHNDGVLRG